RTRRAAPAAGHPGLRDGAHGLPEHHAGGHGEPFSPDHADDFWLDGPVFVFAAPGRHPGGPQGPRPGWALAAARHLEQPGHGGQFLPGFGAPGEPLGCAAGPGIRGPGFGSNLYLMPDLFEPADPRRGNRPLTDGTGTPPETNGQFSVAVAPPPAPAAEPAA